MIDLNKYYYSFCDNTSVKCPLLIFFNQKKILLTLDTSHNNLYFVFCILVTALKTPTYLWMFKALTLIALA